MQAVPSPTRHSQQPDIDSAEGRRFTCGEIAQQRPGVTYGLIILLGDIGSGSNWIGGK
jgi:hypothetical protein